MDRTSSPRVAVALTATAQTPRSPVDESKFVASLSPTFAPWTCKAKLTGISTRSVDALDTEVLRDDTFVSVVREAATGTP